MPDTIAAVATAMVRSAVGILRLSGPRAAEIAEAVFRPENGKKLTDCRSHTLIYGTLCDAQGRSIDRALATFSRAPGSYTGEDTAEIQCHGSPAVLELGLEALFAQGARQAGPGEFTRRAFLNGRLDLMQAEAVADLIDAESGAAVQMAAGQLSGTLSRKVEEIYAALTDLTAHFCAVLDYPDEDLDPFRRSAAAETLAQAERELRALVDTYRRGRNLKSGVPCAIVGRPNVGKSSLLNALLGYERAIVTDLPGTTRDTVEERCELGGVPLRLIDTAGLRESGDTAEQLGMERSRAAMEHAGLILVVLDQSRPAAAEDAELIRTAAALAPTVVLLNKCDLPCAPEQISGLDGQTAQLKISAVTGEGLETLGKLVQEYFPAEEGLLSGEVLTNARQAEAAQRALESVTAAREALELGMPPDAAISDVEGALAALGELTGRSMTEDVTARIFARFCVGK